MGQGVLGANLESWRTSAPSRCVPTATSRRIIRAFPPSARTVTAKRPRIKQTVPAQGIGVSAVWTRSAGKRQTLVAGVDEHEEIGHSDEVLFSAHKDTSAAAASAPSACSARISFSSRRAGCSLSAGDTITGATSTRRSSAIRSLRPRPLRRTPYANRSYDVFDPRATLLHQFNGYVSWSASVYRAFRAPTLNELYRSFRQGTTTTDANPSLSAERLTGGESGVDVHAFSQRLELRGVFFYNQVINPVSNVPCTGTTPDCTLASTGSTQLRENLGRTSAPGFEIDSVVNITNHIQLSTGYQYVDATVLSRTGHHSLTREHMGRTGTAPRPHVSGNLREFQGRHRLLRWPHGGEAIRYGGQPVLDGRIFSFGCDGFPVDWWRPSNIRRCGKSPG